ncbi:Tol-Pal system protein TolB [Streptomyces microflavus]
MLCFAAEDDLWVAPLVPAGHRPGRAWRVTVDRTRVSHPRFSPDGTSIAYTTWRTLDPEIHLAPVDGGPARRLTYWGSTDARVCGWTPDPADASQILAVSSHNQPFSYFSWAYSLPTDGSPGGRLPWGPVSDIAVADLDGERRTLLLTGTPPHEPAAWKRYRGGAMGRLWLHGERLLPDIDGHLASPMFVGRRIAFLSDHEGVGNLYSCRTDGTDLRRHTDHDAFYARNASSDGHRVVYQCAGDLWLVEDLESPDATPRKLEVRLGGPRTGRRSYQVPAASNVDSLSVDETGRASAVTVRGSLYWLTHRDGPARTISDTPGAGAAAGDARQRGPGRVRHRRGRRGRGGDRLPAARQRRPGPAPARLGAAGPGAGDDLRPGRRAPRHRVERRAAAAPGHGGAGTGAPAGREGSQRVDPRRPVRGHGCGDPGQCGAGRRAPRAHRADPLGQRARPRPGLLPRRRLADLVPPGHRPLAATDQAGPDLRTGRPGDRGRHQRPLRGREPGLHGGWPLPRVPVLAGLRPGVRRPHRRPLLPAGLPPLPGPALLGDPLPLRALPGRAPGGGRSRPDRRSGRRGTGAKGPRSWSSSRAWRAG